MLGKGYLKSEHLHPIVLQTMLVVFSYKIRINIWSAMNSLALPTILSCLQITNLRASLDL
jgi:hypothetical protein